MTQPSWYRGQLIENGRLELTVSDPGLLYGATVFTTLRVYQQSLNHPLTNWQAHCDRICHSLRIFGWSEPDWNQVQQGAIALLAHYPVLRITIFPDGRELITGRELPADLTVRQQNGIVAWVAEAPPYQRPLPEHKTGNYLPAWLALQTAQRQGAQEAILINVTGDWLETSTGNLWGWRDHRWWTPPLTAGILPGLARSQLMQWLISQGHSITEEAWTVEVIGEFDAIAYSNSVVEIVPIHTVLKDKAQLFYNARHRRFEDLRSCFRH